MAEDNVHLQNIDSSLDHVYAIDDLTSQADDLKVRKELLTQMIKIFSLKDESERKEQVEAFKSEVVSISYRSTRK
jgi:hypothetical protein